MLSLWTLLLIRKWSICIILLLFQFARGLSQPLDDVDIHVVVSHFSSKSKSLNHYNEIETSIAANLLNPSITTLHTLYEASDGDKCSDFLQRLLSLIRSHWPDKSVQEDKIKSHFGCTEITSGRANLHEFLIEYPHRLFYRNGRSERKTVVVVINGDIVLDSSIKRLSTLRHGHVAALTVNTGPDMVNCCFDTFQAVVSTEKVNIAAQARAKAAHETVPEDIILSCAPEYGASCQHRLPDSDESPHVENLRAFYQASRLSEKAVQTCTNHQWRLVLFYFILF
jgi:hypothetical protein